MKTKITKIIAAVVMLSLVITLIPILPGQPVEAKKINYEKLYRNWSSVKI